MEDDNYKDTPTKECPRCEGRGYFTHQNVPIEIECNYCKGSGVVDMTDEEIQELHEANLDHEADLSRDD